METLRMTRRLALCSLAGLAAGCARPRAAAHSGPRSEKDRKPAPGFTVKDANGQTLKLSDYKGKVVLLNFWATWCGPCKIEIPWFVEFEREFKDRGFAVLGIAMDEEGWEVVKPYIEERRVNYRVAIGTEEMAVSYGGVDSLPTTFVIDREGRIADVHIGLVTKKDYRDGILQILG